MRLLSASAELLRKAYFLARPYGRKRLGGVFLLVLAQGVLQVVGVTSIFPFLALAADPQRIRTSQFGRWFLEVLPPMDDHRLLIVAGLLALVMLFLSNAVNLAGEVTRVRYAHGFGHWLRLRLLRQIASQPWGFFLQHNSGVLLKKVTSDVAQYVQGVLLPLLEGAARLITVALLLLLLLFVDPVIAVAAGIGLGGFYVAVFLYLTRRLRAVSNGLKDANRGVMREVNQLLGGIKPVKVHGVEDFFIGRFARHSLEQAQLLAWVPVYSNGPRYLVEPLAFGGLVAVVLVFAAQGREFVDLLPTLGVMALAGYRLLPALQLFYGQITQLATMKQALEEVYDEFVSVEPGAKTEKIQTTSDLQRPPSMRWEREIRLENVTFTYPGAAGPVLNAVSLTIPKYSSVAFVGQTGCGKSTLLDLILGLHCPDSGRITVDGRDLTPNTIRSWQAGIGYVPQDIFLLDGTLAENIALGVPRDRIDLERLKEVCKTAQILDLIERELPKGFETTVGERGVRLSGGQRQRIGLARSLYLRPGLLILDEATSALDHVTEAALVRAINSLQGSITIILVTHRLAAADSCRTVYSLEKHACSPALTLSSG